MIKKKLIIGTANFGQKYGIAKSNVNLKSLSKILKYAEVQKLENFDTSTTYNSNKILFDNLNYKSKINLKIIPNKKWENLDHIYKVFEKIKNNKKLKLYSVMFHDPNFLFTSQGQKIYKSLLVLKKKNFFKKIGVSIYDFQDLSFILKNFKINIIQCPFSILDRRLISDGWLKLMKSKKVEIHSRSIFFQGLLTNENLTKHKYFKKWRPNFQKWFNDIYENDLNATDICLSYVLNYNIDKIVVGINDHHNLESIINFKKVINLKNFEYIKSDDKNLYDARKWSHLWLK